MKALNNNPIHIQSIEKSFQQSLPIEAELSIVHVIKVLPTHPRLFMVPKIQNFVV